MKSFTLIAAAALLWLTTTALLPTTVISDKVEVSRFHNGGTHEDSGRLLKKTKKSKAPKTKKGKSKAPVKKPSKKPSKQPSAKPSKLCQQSCTQTEFNDFVNNVIGTSATFSTCGDITIDQAAYTTLTGGASAGAGDFTATITNCIGSNKLLVQTGGVTVATLTLPVILLQ